MVKEKSNFLQSVNSGIKIRPWTIATLLSIRRICFCIGVNTMHCFYLSVPLQYWWINRVDEYIGFQYKPRVLACFEAIENAASHSSVTDVLPSHQIFRSLSGDCHLRNNAAYFEGETFVKTEFGEPTTEVIFEVTRMERFLDENKKLYQKITNTRTLTQPRIFGHGSCNPMLSWEIHEFM